MMPDDAIRLSGVDASEVGRVLLAAEMPVSGLYTHARDIEDYFIGSWAAPVWCEVARRSAP